MPRLLVAVVLAASVSAVARPDDLPPDVLAAARAITVNRELVKHVAKFTCLETIQRVDLARNRRKIRAQDVVQVEVAVGGGHEVFSWPGQNHFSDHELGEIVGHGMMATGLFQSMANTVFVGNAAAVKLLEKSVLHARPAYRFSYKVPSFQSRWEVNWLGARGIVGEEGEFWVDASHFTLLRLIVNAVDMPPVLPLQHLQITIDYRPESLGTAKTLLPESASVLAAEWNGALHRDDVSFSHCRVFGAESTLLLSTAELVREVSKFQRNREVLPADLTLPLALETPIDSTNAMIGDKIRARLQERVVLPDSSTIPEGAIAEGYLRQLEKLDSGGAPYYQVGLEFDRLLWPDHSAEFFAEAFSIDSMASLSHATYTQNTRDWFNNRSIEYHSETFHPVHIPGVASFMLEGNHVHVPKGFGMVWKTQETGRSPKKAN